MQEKFCSAAFFARIILINLIKTKSYDVFAWRGWG
jgi:hypothetical protein